MTCFRRPSRGVSLGLPALGLFLACGPTDDNQMDLNTASGGNAPSSSGGGESTGGTGVEASGGLADSGSGGSTGPNPASSGGAANQTPVDCTGIESAGYELCSSTNDTCRAVFEDSSGCDAVCAAAGLQCASAFENLDSTCGPDESLPALPCNSGHQSDFCVCGRGDSSGSGGASSSGGGSGTGGATGSGGSPAMGTGCNADTSSPVITVSKTASSDFSTVQAAIDSLPGSNTTPTIIRIAPGTYQEKLEVNVPHITLCGEVGQAENTLLTYGDGADTSNGNGGTLGTTGSRSVHISADDVSVENITFENTRGEGSQAVALLAYADRLQFRNSRFIGFQDTLYVRGGRQYYRDSYIEGTVDYIFGDATAVFDECTIHTVSGGGSAVTAPSTPQEQAYGIVFLGGELTAASSVSNGSQALGRNWRPYGSTTYVQTVLGAHVSGVGWIKMGDNTLATARFSEFQTSGPGANPTSRASEAKQLSDGEAASFTVDNLLGDWDPSFAE